MHSFHPSRGRVLTQVLFVLGVAGFLVGAWLQTQATALLGAAGFAALYGLSHLLDLKRPKPVQTAEPQVIGPTAANIVVPMVPVEEMAVETEAEEATVSPTASRSGAGRRSGGSRKGGGRRAKSSKAEKVVQVAPREEADAPWPMAGDPQPVELAQAHDDDEQSFAADVLSTQPHIAPLFEPEPFARMQRRAFGRRGRI